MNIVLYVLIGVFALFLLIALSIASFSSSHFYEVYSDYDDKVVSSFMKAIDFAKIVQANKFHNSINIRQIPGDLTDSYNSGSRSISLSERTYNRATVSSLAVIAHEFGHAVQDFENFKNFDRYMRLRKMISRFGFLIMPAFIAGVLVLILGENLLLLGIGLCAFSVVLFFIALSIKIILLSVEKDASNKGIMLLREFGVMEDEEIILAKKVLDAAYLTYVGDFFRAILAWTFLTRKTKLY